MIRCNLAMVLMGMMPLSGQQPEAYTVPQAVKDGMKNEPVGPVAPEISLSHQRDYYRADGKVQRAQKAVEESQKALVDAQNEMREASMAIMHDCGEYGPAEDPTRKSLICTPKQQGK